MGMSKVDAYMAVAPGANYNTAHKGAWRYLNEPEVQECIKEMKRKMAFRMTWNGFDSEDALTKIYTECMSEGDMATALRAVQELNKMGGYHAPERKINASIDLDISAENIDAIMDNLGYRKQING